MIEVSAAIITNEQGKILACKRGNGGTCAFMWEFPGGKVEPGETGEECLVRECLEELSIKISVSQLFSELEYEYPDRTIKFKFYLASIMSGVPKLSVHEDTKWVLPKELPCLDFCPADKEVIKKLAETL